MFYGIVQKKLFTGLYSYMKVKLLKNIFYSGSMYKKVKKKNAVWKTFLSLYIIYFGCKKKE